MNSKRQCDLFGHTASYIKLRYCACAKAFTPNLFVKQMGITLEKSCEILKILSKYRLIDSTSIELDDEMQTVYHFNPSPSFVALLIFAREMIDTPSVFAYNCESIRKPYLK